MNCPVCGLGSRFRTNLKHFDGRHPWWQVTLDYTDLFGHKWRTFMVAGVETLDSYEGSDKVRMEVAR